jgi:hypothetical protein
VRKKNTKNNLKILIGNLELEQEKLKETLVIARWLNSRLQDQLDIIEYWVDELAKMYDRILQKKEWGDSGE